MCHTVALSHMLGIREGSLRKLEESERVVDSRSKITLCFVLLGFSIEFLVGNTGSSLPCSRHCFKFSVSVLTRQLDILLCLLILLLLASLRLV